MLRWERHRSTLQPGAWRRRYPVRIGLTVIVATLACRSAEKKPADSAPHPTADAHHAPIHNVFDVAPGLISGSAPEGEAGFAALEDRGVRTILSVDGATPEVDAAHRHGMRYVHLPIGYHGIDPPRQLEIARAVRDLPGPVYVHCHHGKHRGPAAAASAAVELGLLSADDAITFMKDAGTSDSYPGLYACVRNLHPATPEQLAGAPASFPEIAPVPGFVLAMSHCQDAYDHLVEIRDAGWQTPPTHPDLVPLAEAGQLENLLRALQEAPEREKHPADFAEMLHAAWKASLDFEQTLSRKAPDAELKSALGAVNDSCKACHVVYRNKR
ncbi:MAG: cytochrome c [Phycisphaerales bacterium]|nr:cytochrome c [Phycisphaerales bacterium]